MAKIPYSTDVDAHVGQQIRAHRVELGLTQEDIAKALALSYQQVQKYETGANRVSAGRLYQIAGLLQVPVENFFKGVEAPAVPLPHGGINRGDISFAKNFQRIRSAKARAVVVTMVAAIADQDEELHRLRAALPNAAE